MTRQRLKRKAAFLYFILFCIVVLSGIGLWYFYSSQPNRVNRNHSGIVADKFEYLTHRMDFSSRDRSWLNRKEAEADLDELEWLLENRYSYLKLRGIDYRAALDSIRCSLGDGISRGMFALQLMKFVALFGDGHSGISDPAIQRMFSGFLPFLIAQSEGRFIAFKTDRSGLLDPQHPFLRKIDNIELDIWLLAAGRLTAQGSPQFTLHRSLRNLRFIQYLRKELKIETSDSVNIELESADGQSLKTMSILLTEEYPIYGPWPKTQSRILPENIGYLRIQMMLNAQEFLDELIEYMNQFRDTKGLIIDIRGNGGGSRAPLRALLPFFMEDEAPPKIVNIAAYRLGHRKDILDARWLYPENWKGFSEAEKAAIKQVKETFKPEWDPPGNQFSQWHYFIIGPRREKGYYHYNHPVIILMDTTNFSASDVFLGAFKGHPNVTLMGSASGGGSGRYQQYRLHHSLIAVNLSSMASFRPNGRLYEGNGIQPDVIINPVITDFIGTSDTLLDAAICLINEK